MTHMTVLSEVYTCAFIKTLSNGKHEWHLDTISIVHSKQYKTAREGQMFSAQPKVIKIWERDGLPTCVHKHTFPPSPSCSSENKSRCLNLELNFKLEILEESKLFPPKQKNPAIWSMPLLAIHCKIKLCAVQLVQNRGNFYYFKPKINICITTVPEWISWDTASCFQRSPEMIAKE